jgi:uncharacterized protein YjbI with pentapeptide repeats
MRNDRISPAQGKNHHGFALSDASGYDFSNRGFGRRSLAALRFGARLAGKGMSKGPFSIQFALRALRPLLSAGRTGRAVVLALFLLSAVGASTAWAACTDPPGYEVNWQRCNLNGLDFTGADLREARLRDASFLRSNLRESDLSGVNAYRAKFVNANLAGAKLEDAYLLEADLTKANLTGASLVNADLRQARFFGADLRGSSLTGARLRGADLTRARLDGAIWVDGEKVCGGNSVGRCN